MALDPQAQDVINLVIKSGRPAYNTLSPKDARQLFRETRPGSPPTPAGRYTRSGIGPPGPSAVRSRTAPISAGVGVAPGRVSRNSCRASLGDSVL